MHYDRCQSINGELVGDAAIGNRQHLRQSLGIVGNSMGNTLDPSTRHRTRPRRTEQTNSRNF